ncbi:hypothetical protein HOO54_05985 [Bacillus sp. WMMC1349]|uniref:hypothetical protein n=1 Tax=Bacillus sp. WMMC1349 TaxID=2736254 RepID=UPI001558318F|nr:hypothetical protein [Bacillus sp. WMMC1349]NPC91795.1 hypothetical protein [Bacillus sp. WMMC1349]
MNKKLYRCLVCGYKGLTDNLLYRGKYYKTFEICRCCGFQFGYSEDHDVELGFIVTPKHLIEATFQLYRKQWIESGMKIPLHENFPKEYRNGDCLKFEVLLRQLKSLKLDLDNFEINGFND